MMDDAAEPARATFQRVVTQCTCGNLRKTARVVTQLYDEFLRPSGLLITQFKLLGAVAGQDGIALSPLAERLDLDPTTLARNLKPLAREGLVLVSPGADRRTRVIRLTPRGRESLEKAFPLWEKAQAWVIAQVGNDRWQSMLSDWANLVSVLGRH